MLYKHPGQTEIWGHKYDLKVCKDYETEKYLQQGWYLTPDEAREKKPHKPKPEKPPEPDEASKSVKVNLNVTFPEDKPKPKKLSFGDLTDEMKTKILRSKKGAKFLAKKFNTSQYAVNMTRKQAKEDELDKKTDS